MGGMMYLPIKDQELFNVPVYVVIKLSYAFRVSFLLHPFYVFLVSLAT